MDNFKQILGYPETKEKQRKMWIIFSLIYVALGLIEIFLAKDVLNSGGMFVLYGLILLIVVLIEQKRISDKYFIEVGENGIKFRNHKTKVKDYSWSKLERVVFHPMEIELRTKNGENDKILLENIFYKDVVNLKSQIQKFAEKAGVTAG